MKCSGYFGDNQSIFTWKLTDNWIAFFSFRETFFKLQVTPTTYLWLRCTWKLWHGQTCECAASFWVRSLFVVNKFLSAQGWQNRLINKLMQERVRDTSMLRRIRREWVRYLKAVFLFLSGIIWVTQTTTLKHITFLWFESHSVHQRNPAYSNLSGKVVKHLRAKPAVGL